MKKNLNQKGFTLVEMLVVVAIIAILASVFLVGLRGFRGSAYDSRRLSDIQKVQSYLELYYNQQRHYPVASTWEQLQSELSGAGIGVNSLPNDPVAGQKYRYESCGDPVNPQSYILSARMSDPKSRIVVDQEGISSICSNVGKTCDKVNGEYCVSP